MVLLLCVLFANVRIELTKYVLLRRRGLFVCLCVRARSFFIRLIFQPSGNKWVHDMKLSSFVRPAFHSGDNLGKCLCTLYPAAMCKLTMNVCTTFEYHEKKLWCVIPRRYSVQLIFFLFLFFSSLLFISLFINVLFCFPISINISDTQYVRLLPPHTLTHTHTQNERTNEKSGSNSEKNELTWNKHW